jgi:hypothetical protein
MESAVQTWFARRPSGRWLALCGLGALVVASGFLSPLLLRERTPPRPAQDGGRDVPPPAEVPDTAALLTRLALGTVFVLGLCVITLRLGQRWLVVGAAERDPGCQFEVLETLSVGNRCVVHLLRAGSGHLLAGVDASGLKALIALDATETEAPEAGAPNSSG